MTPTGPEPRPDAGVSRRHFLAIAAAGALTAGALTLSPPVRRRAGAVYEDRIRDLRAPTLPESRPGPLSDAVALLLPFAVEPLVGFPLERRHYEAYYRWRSANLSGYRDLYESLGREIGEASGGFASETIAVRGQVLREIASFWEPPGTFELLTDRRSILYRRYFVDESLALFDRTDAWVVMGYEAWPGTARGLDRYVLPLSDAPAGPS